MNIDMGPMINDYSQTVSRLPGGGGSLMTPSFPRRTITRSALSRGRSLRDTAESPPPPAPPLPMRCLNKAPNSLRRPPSIPVSPPLQSQPQPPFSLSSQILGDLTTTSFQQGRRMQQIGYHLSDRISSARLASSPANPACPNGLSPEEHLSLNPLSPSSPLSLAPHRPKPGQLLRSGIITRGSMPAVPLLKKLNNAETSAVGRSSGVILMSPQRNMANREGWPKVGRHN
ncbi:unnamed protein product [Protopolystoma xenopodis]|uniref:Uncharacterized protein n=1 Tax=Protopolystoma xenopodis TaxID=117903 RepID=A0A448WM35_9PLAT|nr:unnamed protein product [Protopolystoma xenopodis]